MKKKIIVRAEDYLSLFKNKKLGQQSLFKYKTYFPLYASPKLAGIIADVTGDGHLGRGLIQFISKNKTDVINFKERVESIFKVEGYVRIPPSNPQTWECLFGNNFLSRMLMLAGAPYGNKAATPFLIPDWIFDGDEKIKALYLRHLFDCEGSIIFQKGRRIRIKISMRKDVDKFDNLVTYFNQIRSLLEGFGIKSTGVTIGDIRKYPNGRITKGAEFEIHGTRKNMISILNYQSDINFGVTAKKQRLKNYIGNLLIAPKLMPR